ncbi:MAG: HEPN domain-containing protein [Candidatus Schekmanbacteria bacterium]|nr:HEPN domain-containing protein [Candidatus Schekmanbacteria bacterium]
MSYEKFLKSNLIKKQQPDFKQIKYQLKRTEKDLKTAESLLSIDLTWAFAVAYHAMMRASKALMFSKGFLPTSKQSHKTIIEFTRLIMGDEYENIISRFNRMRRKRHDFIYDSQNHITTQEAETAIDTAKKLIEKIKDFVTKENPQKELFRKK